MDIGDLITFKPKGADDGKPPKVSIYKLYNRPIRVLKWQIENSRFHDGSGQFAEITCQTLDDNQTVRFNTGSGVIMSQLLEIANVMNEQKMNEDERTFTCVIRSMSNFVKMFPMEVHE